MRCEAVHQPPVKNGLRAHVEQPGQTRFVVVDDRQQGPAIEHLPELESGVTVGATKDATGHVKELTVPRAASGAPLEI